MGRPREQKRLCFSSGLSKCYLEGAVGPSRCDRGTLGLPLQRRDTDGTFAAAPTTAVPTTAAPTWSPTTATPTVSGAHSPFPCGRTAHASHGCCRRGRGGRLRDGLGRAVDVELRVMPAGWMRDYRTQQRHSKFSKHTVYARRHGAGCTGRPVVHRQDSEHVRLLSPPLLLPGQPTVSADSCSDLSGQNFTGQLPDTITRLRLLSSMCARVDSVRSRTPCQSDPLHSALVQACSS